MIGKEPSQEEIDRYHRFVGPIAAFQKEAAPLVFKWLEWIVLLSLLIYVERSTGVWPLTALKWLLGFFLWLHFIQFFSPDYRWKPYKEALPKAGLLSMLLSLGATIGMMMASLWFATVFADNHY